MTSTPETKTEKKPEHYKVILSDCHLSAGRYYEGRLNPHEDFHHDAEMAGLIDYFSTGQYGEGPSGPVDVELILAGDFLDPLNVPVNGEFEEVVTEDLAVHKVEAILKGHPEVCQALRRFAAMEGKRITYLIGNHDADLFFPRVREVITRAWDPDGYFPSQRVRVVADTDRLDLGAGVQVRHGNQLEVGSDLNFELPMIRRGSAPPMLNLPWSSLYVLKIVNHLKWDREYVDKVRPVKVFLFLGIFFDFWFTLRYLTLSVIYFLRTRIQVLSQRKKTTFRTLVDFFRQETAFWLDLEEEARRELAENPDVKILIMGHTHRPLNRIYPDGKQYINTGTWVQMVNLDYRGLGQQMRRTFALVKIRDGVARADLRQWMGDPSPHRMFLG